MIKYKVKARLARNIGTDDFTLEAFDKLFETNIPISSRKDAFNFYFNIIDVLGQGDANNDISKIFNHVNNAQVTYFNDKGRLKIKLNNNAPKELGLGVYLIIEGEEYMIHGYNDDERDLDIARNLSKEIDLYIENNWNTLNWTTSIKYWDYEIATSSKDGIFKKEVLWTSMDFWEHGKPPEWMEEEELVAYEKDSFLLNIIEQDENRNLEFKSTLRFCKREKSPQPYIEHGILKTITAFANTHGGVLLIGVNDDKEIVGVQDDLNSFKNKSKDEFLLHFDSLIKHNFEEPIDVLLSYEFYKTAKELVFIISVETSKKPRFLNTKLKGKEFYIRRAASSWSLNVEEAVKYCFDKWSH
jgi:hypothetical protein